MTYSNQIQDWEKEFETLTKGLVTDEGYANVLYGEELLGIKDFIRSQISKAREEGVREGIEKARYIAMDIEEGDVVDPYELNKALDKEINKL